MKLLLLLILLTGCNQTCEDRKPFYTCPSPKYEPASTPNFKVGDCFIFIKASKEKWEDQPEVIVRVLEVGIEKYLLEVVENPIQHSRITFPISFAERKDRITCPSLDK